MLDKDRHRVSENYDCYLTIWQPYKNQYLNSKQIYQQQKIILSSAKKKQNKILESKNTLKTGCSKYELSISYRFGFQLLPTTEQTAADPTPFMSYDHRLLSFFQEKLFTTRHLISSNITVILHLLTYLLNFKYCMSFFFFYYWVKD